MAGKKVAGISATVKKKEAVLETGIKSKKYTVVVIPGRGRVRVPAVEGSLYFRGNYSQDTGPTHVKDVKGDLYFDGSYTRDTGPTYNKDIKGDLYFDGSYTKDTGPTHNKDIKGDLYFDGSYTKDTGPTHNKDIKGDMYFDGSYTRDTGPTHNKDIKGDMYFDGSYTRDTGPTHIKDSADVGDDHIKYVKGPSDFSREFTISGVLSKKDYLYLARRGCTMKNGVLTVPAKYVDAVRKYLKLDK